MSLPPETETAKDAAGGTGLLAWLSGPRIIWLILAAAAIDSVIPLTLLLGILVSGPGGQLPGIAILGLLGFGIVGLALIWGLVAVATLFRRGTTRIIVLVLMLLPFPSEILL